VSIALECIFSRKQRSGGGGGRDKRDVGTSTNETGKLRSDVSTERESQMT
jgi:hypothetical protein